MLSLRKAAAAAALTLGTLAYSSPALAGDFIDTRVTFLFSDDNIFAGPADFSPQPDFTQRPGVNTFFDNYNTRDSGQETKTDLAVYKRMTGWNPRLETEAAFLIRFDLYADAVTGQGSQTFADDGTYIQVNWLKGEIKEGGSAPGRPPRLYFLGFPFNADRMRLGYSYGITWGGREIFPKNSSPVPGMKFGYDGSTWYVYGGAKTHRQLNDNTNNIETEYAFLGGAGVDVNPMVRIEGAAGYFQKGALPPIGPSDPLAGERINASGFTGQVTLHQGLPIIGSVDIRLYRNDPDFPFNAFAKENYGPGLSWLLSSEVSVLTQNLRDPDTFGQTVIQPAMAGDINAKVKTGYTIAYGDVVYRSLSFILFNVPAFTPYYAFPKGAQVAPQTFLDLGVSHYFPNGHQTPGFVFGYEKPATYTGDTTGAGLPGSNTVVVRQQGNFTILPPGQTAFDILSARVYDRVELSDMLTGIGQITYTLDKNATQLERGPGGIPVRVFKGNNVTNQLAIAAIFQARW
ncbi:MAG TPA: hypothetical protein VMV18_04095 [bacterium]|nr:hypothetical protein [bacterium]